MRTLRAAVLVPLVIAAVIAIVLPLAYLMTASSLPTPIESATTIETVLRQSIESERQSARYAKRIAERENVSWPTPSFTTLPKMTVALYVVENGCPTYFQTASEQGFAWQKRVLLSLIDQAPEGDGWCELHFARRLARRMGADTPLQVAVAADRIHRFLSKEQLVAFDLHSMKFGHAVVGIEAGSTTLMQKPLLELTLPELAELQLAIHPHEYWDDVWVCKNKSLVLHNRDRLIDHLMVNGFIDTTTAARAIEQEPRCISIVRGPGTEFHPE